MNIAVKTYDIQYRYDFDEAVWLCDHKFIYEPPCCSERGSSGNYECGCGGAGIIYCDRDDCTDEYEYEDGLEALGMLEGVAEW